MKMTSKKDSVAQYEKKERGENMENHINTPNNFAYQQHKDKKLSSREQNVCNELLKGKRSATQLTIILGYCDPRSYIRNLRDKGIIVLDEWIKKDDTRYKQYWIEPETQRTGLKHISEVMDCIFHNREGGKNE